MFALHVAQPASNSSASQICSVAFTVEHLGDTHAFMFTPLITL